LHDYVQTLPENPREKIVLHEEALCDKAQDLHFAATAGEDAKVVTDTRGTVVHGTAIDLLDCVPTYIKLDIEGAEKAALEGAVKTISRHAPKLAVCVYHKPADLWELPLYIREIYPAGKMYLRSHGENGFETVLYVLPS